MTLDITIHKAGSVLITESEIISNDFIVCGSDASAEGSQLAVLLWARNEIDKKLEKIGLTCEAAR